MAFFKYWETLNLSSLRDKISTGVGRCWRSGIQLLKLCNEEESGNYQVNSALKWRQFSLLRQFIDGLSDEGQNQDTQQFTKLWTGGEHGHNPTKVAARQLKSMRLALITKIHAISFNDPISVQSYCVYLGVSGPTGNCMYTQDCCCSHCLNQ